MFDDPIRDENREGGRGLRQSCRWRELAHGFALKLDPHVRLERVYDSTVDPIGAYLTIINWFERWEVLRLRRHLYGKPAVAERDDEGCLQLYGPAGECWIDQLDNLQTVRDQVLIEGCRLGASPVEMSQLLSKITDAVADLTLWDEVVSKGTDEALGELEHRLELLYDLTTHLEALRTWKAARDGKTPPPAAVRNRSDKRGQRGVSELKALRLLIENPELTIAELAEAVGCTTRTIYNMPRIRAALEARKHDRKALPKGFYKGDGSLEAYN